MGAIFILDPHKVRLALSGVALLFALTVLLLTGCGSGDARDVGNEGASEVSAEEAADSTQADNTKVAADSAETKKGGGKGNLLTRLFHKRGEDEEEEEDPVPVEIGSVEVRNIRSFIGATATLEPEKQANVIAKIAGEVRSIRVEEGDLVSEGQILAILDGKAQEVALEEMAARARGLKLDYERVARLMEQDMVSSREMNDARSRYEESEAQRKAAELRLSYTKVIAPFAGRISRRYIDTGQNLSIGSELFTLVDSNPMLARVHLPEKEAARIRVGQPVIISPDTDLSTEMEGEVHLVAPIVDSRTGTIKVTCRITGETNSIRPGSFVRVRLQTEEHQEVMVIPSRALVPEGGEMYVYKAVGDTVIKLAVGTGFTEDGQTEITEGLAPGDEVITVGQGGLRNGTRYRNILDEESAETDSIDADSAEDDGADDQ